jgi:hypothetical protein
VIIVIVPRRDFAAKSTRLVVRLHGDRRDNPRRTMAVLDAHAEAL